MGQGHLRIVVVAALASMVLACASSRTRATPPSRYYGPFQSTAYLPAACQPGNVPFSRQCTPGVAPAPVAPGMLPTAATQLATSPTYVHVTLVSALIGPSKNNGCQWDGLTCGAGGTRNVISAVDAALATSNPYVAVGAILGGPLADAIEKPDPMGTAEMYTGGRFEKRVLVKSQDNFTPGWGARWLNVRFETATRLSVRIRDADLYFDDDIGAFDVGYGAIAAALATQRVYPVSVYRETYKQVLFVSISVVPAT